MSDTRLPILYSFRRCPYAIRARLALHASGIGYELREVDLRNKPACMLAASPKGSVPVLVLSGSRVIDESWDIMQWALQQHDPENRLGTSKRHVDAALPLVHSNDNTFKASLDRYKYADRHPEHPQTHYRSQGEPFLQQLEMRLQATAYLLGNTPSIADMAIFPFIRQFAGVDQDWFDQSPYPGLRNWAEALTHSAMFKAVMQKHPVWNSRDKPVVIRMRAA
jgi:glutathione S-transferase